MERPLTPPRAVVFDVYRTLMAVTDAPADAGRRWLQLFKNLAGLPAPVSHREFLAASSEVVARHQTRARAKGIPWPEVIWQDVVAETLPGLRRLAPATFQEFVFREIQLRRGLRLADHAAECLRRLRAKGVLLGIASNAQAYTLREFTAILRQANLDLSWFDPALRFWSFEHGFSKPDPHVFRILNARLEARGIRPHEILMVGDREENDVTPALNQGWQAWHLATQPAQGCHGGDFMALVAVLEAA